MKIDNQALQETKRICHVELNKNVSKYNTSHFQVMYQFLKKEFHYLLLFSVISMSIILLTSTISIDISMGTFIICLGLMGSFAISEYMKADYFHTKEILTMSYINMGKSFLYTCSLFTIIEIINFIVICLLLPLSYQRIVMAILCVLFPIFISQMLSLCFMHYISHTFSAIVVYFISYMGVSLFFFIGNRYTTIDLKTSILLILVSVVLYMLIVMKTYKQGRGEEKVWN